MDPEGSLSATTVVLILVLLLTGGVVTRFRKIPKAFVTVSPSRRRRRYFGSVDVRAESTTL